MNAVDGAVQNAEETEISFIPAIVVIYSFIILLH